MCVQSHICILCSVISPFCVSYFTVHNHLRVVVFFFFASYLIERCSVAILVRKKKE